MAGPTQKELYISVHDLKEKYNDRRKISAMCKAIEKFTQSKISVGSVAEAVRFEVIGRSAKKTCDYILEEMRKTKSISRSGKKDTEYHTRAHSSRRAQRIITEDDQDKILKEGIEKPYLLTEEALAKHNLLTGVSELREFACGPCDRYWWKVVLITKTVSRCLRCRVKYNALNRDQEFGIGRYLCQNAHCGHTFYQRCHATQAMWCYNCNELVRNPYIHPKFKKSWHERKPLDPSAQPFQPPPPSVPQPPPYPMYGFLLETLPYEDRVHIERVRRRKVINPSTRHQPTGSTVDTFLTQSVVSDLDVPLAGAQSDSDEEDIIIPGSDDSDSSSESDPTPVPSDGESVGPAAGELNPSGSDSESENDDDPNRHRKREIATDTSDSSTDSEDEFEMPSETPSESSSGKLSSQVSTMPDSGIGTASTIDTMDGVDSAKPPSVGETSSVSSSKFNALRIADIKPEYPGVLFSKQYFQRDVDDKGAVITGEGIKVSIPSKAIVPGDQVPVLIQACLKGPFKLRRGYAPISPVYLLYPPCVFHGKIQLIIDTYADLEATDDITFLTSPDKHSVHGEEPRWKFTQDPSSHTEVTFVPGSHQVKVQVQHFCFGVLARRKTSRSLKHWYLVTLHKPKLLKPYCHAIFTVSLNHKVYLESLETYLSKKYGNEEFLDSQKITRLTDNEIKLFMPEAGFEDITITPDTDPCIIKREVVDLPLKHKRFRREPMSSYPPRIVLTIQRTPDTPERLRPLMCTLVVQGTEDEIKFNLSIPPSPSPSLSSHSSQSESVEASLPHVTLDDLIQRTYTTHNLLMQKCSQQHIREISEHVSDWLSLARCLGLTPADISRITTDPNIFDRSQEVLIIWNKKFGFKATYKILVDAMLQQKNSELAQRICQLSKE